MTNIRAIESPKHSEEFAEFIGIMLGDGHVGKEQIQITLSSLVDKVYTVYVMNLFERTFGYKPSIFKKNDCNAYCIYSNSVNLVKILVKNGLKIGNKVKLQVSVPNWITTNKRYSRLCCRGLIDTDGCISIHKYNVNGKQYKYKKLIFTNHSAPLADFVFNTLKNIGLNPKIVIRLEKRRIWLYNSNEVIKYLVKIGSGNEKLLKFMEGIPNGSGESLLNFDA